MHGWAARQRRLARAQVLPRPVRRQLDGLGFPWSREEQAWERRYAQVLGHWKRHGRRVQLAPTTVLGRWWAEQREALEAGVLDGHQEQRVMQLVRPRPAGPGEPRE